MCCMTGRNVPQDTGRRVYESPSHAAYAWRTPVGQAPARHRDLRSQQKRDKGSNDVCFSKSMQRDFWASHSCFPADKTIT